MSEAESGEDTRSRRELGRRDLLEKCVRGVAAANLAPVMSAGQSSPQGRRPPNILYIHSHDTGRYIQPYGHPVPTPNLQRLAEQGVLFRQAFSAAPTCSPSRAAMLTGQCPHSCGMLGLANRKFSLVEYDHHMARTLRRAGYMTVGTGVQHVLQDQSMAGWDRIIPFGPNKDIGPAKGVVAAATGFFNERPKQPFFMAAGFFETHRTFPRQLSPAEDPRYILPPAPIPDTPETRHDMAGFKASARSLDNSIGEILRSLESNGLADNTLVIFSTDHGIPFPNMKCSLRDAGTGVSLIMRGPREFSGGKVCEAMVSQMDMFPTICDLAEIEHPAWLEGRSMMPLMRGESREINEELFAEVNYHASYEPKRSVRTHRWKYIRHFDDRTKPVLPNADRCPSVDLWVKHGWADRTVDREQLYDLVFDPNETHNAIAETASRSVADEMRGRLDRWMRSTRDPLLQGPVKAPSGAEISDPDGHPERKNYVVP